MFGRSGREKEEEADERKGVSCLGCCSAASIRCVRGGDERVAKEGLLILVRKKEEPNGRQGGRRSDLL